MAFGVVLSERGKRLSYETFGDDDAPAIVLVHASGMSSSEWRKYTPELATSARVVVPDLLGYGRSEPVPARSPISAEEDAEALRALLGVVGPAAVVGHSYGGYLASKLTLAAPALVRKLVLIEPVLFGALRQTADAESADELARLYEPGFLEEATGGGEAWMASFLDYWGGAGAWERLPEPARRANLRVAWKVFNEVRDLSNDSAPFAAYRSLAGRPVTLVRGETTTVCARRILALLAAELPDARVHVVAQAGHMSPVTHPGEVLAIVRAALG